MNSNYKKNVFVKNDSINENLSDLSDKSENLSDELNKLVGNTNKNTNKNTNINNKDDKPKDFNINNIYNGINNLFLNDYTNCKITGEIISFKISDINAWITIKSDEFQISCIFWKITLDKNFNNIKLTKPGDKYIFEGKFNIMKKNLNIYLNVKSMVKFGKGEYLDIYDQYRIKIKEMKLGEPKKQLEIFPYNIGIITASGGAAIQDILQTFKLDKFIGKIIIKNSLVQGSQCSKSLINSIEWFESNYSTSQIDLLMVTRGGGGWEDLVGFSDWDLIIKLSQVKIVTLSAVGHQIDNQLTDEICDYKFATPSIGAKFIVESQLKFKSYLNKYKNILEQIIKNFNDLKNKYNYSITNNYTNIIKKYDIKQITLKIKNYSNQINKIINKYSNLKNIFYTKLSNLKPTIIRKNELTSIEDFINTETNNEIKPKKIEIYFIDGMVGLNYKITKYEKYN
jgi:exodeoxyribonuclease VII large subunit